MASRSPVIRVIKHVIRGRNMDLICVREAVYFTPARLRGVTTLTLLLWTPCGRRPRQKNSSDFIIHILAAILEGILGDNCRLGIKRFSHSLGFYLHKF